MLSDGADEGYTYVSISGGEPLLYPPLEQLLKHAKETGFTTAITTNGILLKKKQIEKLKGVTDLIAISLDGIPESHNRIRNSETAFSKMFANLENLRQSKIPFGFIFTLTQYNLHELEWVIEFALKQGAGLLQIHPLESAGFAIDHLSDEHPDRKESAYAYLYSNTMTQKLEGKLAIQIDYANRTVVQENPELVYAVTHKPNQSTLLSDCIGELTIEPDGTIVPIQYGFNRKYALGNLHNTSFKQQSKEWKQIKMDDFLQLCNQVYLDIIDDSKAFIFNWNEIITAASNRSNTMTIPLSPSKKNKKVLQNE